MVGLLAILLTLASNLLSLLNFPPLLWWVGDMPRFRLLI